MRLKKDKLRGSVLFLFLLLSLILFSKNLLIPTVEAHPASPTIGVFQAPPTVYANKYFLLNATINDADGIADFVNATIEINGTIVLLWVNSTNVFSESQDASGYCTLDASNSFKTNLNTTAHRLSWKIKLTWTYPEGSISVISTNTNVFDSAGASGSGVTTSLFTFEDDLIVYSASVSDSRVNPSDSVTFSGAVYYENTTDSPVSGSSALSFDGVDDQVVIPYASNLELATFSVAFWAKVSDLSATRCVIGNRDSELTFDLKFQSNGLHSDIGDGAAWLTAADYAFTPELNRWYHVVYVVTSGGDCRIYLDGECKATITFTGTPKFVNSTGNVRIGQWGGGSEWFKGIVDEVRVYNRALTVEEISEHYRGVYSNETGLVGYWDFDGDVEDKSGQGNHGTNYGASWITGAYVNVDVKVELSSALKKAVGIVNATDGTFLIPSVTVESSVASYSYNVYTYTDQASVQNKTVNVIVDGRNVTSLAFIPLGGGDYNFTVLYNYAYNNSEIIANCEVGMLFPNGTLYNTAITNSSGHAMFRLNQSELLAGGWILYGHNETLYGITHKAGNQTLSFYGLTLYTTKWTGETFGEGAITIKYGSVTVNQPNNGTEWLYPTNWSYELNVVWQGIKVNQTSSYSFSSNTTQALKLNVWDLTINAKDNTGTILSASPTNFTWTFPNGTAVENEKSDGSWTLTLMNGTHYYQVKYQGQWVSENVTVALDQANIQVINKNCWVYSLTVYVTDVNNLEKSGSTLTLTRTDNASLSDYGLTPKTAGYYNTTHAKYAWSQLANQTSSYTVTASLGGQSASTTTSLTADSEALITLPAGTTSGSSGGYTPPVEQPPLYIPPVELPKVPGTEFNYGIIILVGVVGIAVTVAVVGRGKPSLETQWKKKTRFVDVSSGKWKKTKHTNLTGKWKKKARRK